MTNDEKTKFEILRQKAEELLNTLPTPRDEQDKLLSVPSKTSSPLSEINMMKLIHELEVYQVELELQNEELQRAKALADIATNKYTNLYDFAPSGYFTLSKMGDIIDLNLASALMLGKERSKLIDNRFSLFVSSDTRSVFNLFIDKVFESKSPETCEVTLISNDDLPTNVLLTGIVTENDDQCNITMVDITKRKQAEIMLLEEKQRVKTILELVGDPIFLKDNEHRIIFANRAFLDLFELDEASVLGKTLAENVPENEMEHFLRVDRSVLDTGISDSCEEELTVGGTKHTIITKKIRFIDKSENRFLVGSIHDITERKQWEVELISAKKQAEESDKLKSAFLANMSHEIRTPMNGILGFAELLKEPELTGEQQQKYICIIEKAGARMLNTINDIISISRIESGEMNISVSNTDINQQLEDVYNFFKPESEKKRIKFSFKTGLSGKKAIIKTDPDKMNTILFNLVKNAIKYTDKGSVEIGYRLKADSDPLELVFYVKDTGIGIPENRQKAIFERFIKADINDKMARQGSGLGLAIAKAYIEVLGGKMSMESKEGLGSVFYYTLPYHTELEEKSVTENAVLNNDIKKQINPQVSGLKILIAEDDENSEMYLRVIIKSICKELLTAETGREAIAACRNHPDIDLILMDIQMPSTNGYEATREIREFNKEVIIIAQTAFALAGDREKAIEAGCNDYITKPINKEKIMQVLAKYFQQ